MATDKSKSLHDPTELTVHGSHWALDCGRWGSQHLLRDHPRPCYHLKNDAVTLKDKGAPPNNTIWPFFNLLNLFFQWLQTEDAKKVLKRRRWKPEDRYYPSHWHLAMWYCTCLPFLSEECEKDPYTRGGRILRSFASIVDDLQEFEDTLLDYCANDGLLTMLILWGMATK